MDMPSSQKFEALLCLHEEYFDLGGLMSIVEISICSWIMSDYCERPLDSIEASTIYLELAINHLVLERVY